MLNKKSNSTKISKEDIQYALHDDGSVNNPTNLTINHGIQSK